MQTKWKEQICPTEVELPIPTLGEITFQVDLGEADILDFKSIKMTCLQAPGLQIHETEKLDGGPVPETENLYTKGGPTDSLPGV